MSDENIVTYTAEELRGMRARGGSLTDWERLRTMTEDELEAAIASDPDWQDLEPDWSKAQVCVPTPAGSLCVDAAWFKAQGPDYETRLAALLRHHARDHAAE